MILVNEQTSVPPLLQSHNRAVVKYDTRPLLDIRAAAVRLGCSERFVRRLVQERRIPFVKLGGTRVRFVDADLDKWVSGQRVEPQR
jgi:excisionase family DNA binding protein